MTTNIFIQPNSPTPTETHTHSTKLSTWTPLTSNLSVDAENASQTLKLINTMLVFVLRKADTLTHNSDIAQLDTSIPNQSCQILR